MCWNCKGATKIVVQVIILSAISSSVVLSVSASKIPPFFPLWNKPINNQFEEQDTSPPSNFPTTGFSYSRIPTKHHELFRPGGRNNWFGDSILSLRPLYHYKPMSHLNGFAHQGSIKPYSKLSVNSADSTTPEQREIPTESPLRFMDELGSDLNTQLYNVFSNKFTNVASKISSNEENPHRKDEFNSISKFLSSLTAPNAESPWAANKNPSKIDKEQGTEGPVRLAADDKFMDFNLYQNSPEERVSSKSEDWDNQNADNTIGDSLDFRMDNENTRSGPWISQFGNSNHLSNLDR